MKRLLVLLLVLAVAGTARARNGKKHVMGTVTTIKTASLDVTAKNGELTTVKINPTTRWLKGLNEIKPDEVKVGDQVVIHATQKEGNLLAAEVAVRTPKHKR